MGSGTYESYTTGADSAILVSGQWKAGQTFTPSTSHTIDRIRLLLFRVGSPGTINAYICETDSGLPNGAVLVSGTTSGDSLTTNTNGSYRDIYLGAGTALIASTQYVVVIEAPDGTPGTHEVYWRMDSTSPTYAGGTTVRRPTSPGEVDVWEAYSGKDCLFIEYGGVEVELYSPTDEETEIAIDANLQINITNGMIKTWELYIDGNLYTTDDVIAWEGIQTINPDPDFEAGTTHQWYVKVRDYTTPYNWTQTSTWSFTTEAAANIRSVWLGSGGNFIVVAAEDGIYLSTDFAENWTRKTPDDVEDTDWAKGICSGDGTYIIVVSSVNAIYRSANSGVAWGAITPAGGDTFSVNDLTISDDGQYAVIVGQNSTDPTKSCYISTDYGATWTAKTPIDTSIEWTECDISNDGAVIAVSTSGYFYVSFDSGVTWLAQSLAATAENWACLSISGDGNSGLVTNLSNNDEFFIGTYTELYSEATWAESALTAAARALLDDLTTAAQQTTLELGTGDSPTFTGLTLTAIAHEGADVDKFLVDSTGVIKYRTGAELADDIGAAGINHIHDGHTLQHDGVNSDGGAFGFNTTGAVTFNQNLIAPNLTLTGFAGLVHATAGVLSAGSLYSAAYQALLILD